MIPNNVLIVDRQRHEMLMSTKSKDFNSNYKLISLLDVYAIKEDSGYYTLLKNRKNSETILTEQEFEQLIMKGKS